MIPFSLNLSLGRLLKKSIDVFARSEATRQSLELGSKLERLLLPIKIGIAMTCLGLFQRSLGEEK